MQNIEFQAGRFRIRGHLTDPGPDGPLFLCLHGLGDSGIAFEDLYRSIRHRRRFLVPDMPGYGASASDCPAGISFDVYVDLLEALLDLYAMGDVIVIAHSMGGAIGTLLCRKAMLRPDSKPESWRISGLVNIEGNLLPADQFLSRQATAEAEKGRYETWFDKFRATIASRSTADDNDRSILRYHRSLQKAQSGAFLANSRELVGRSGETKAGEVNEIARVYLDLSLPKLYCLGEKSHPPETLAFLSGHRENLRIFPAAGHSVMIDTPSEFQNVLTDFLNSSV